MATREVERKLTAVFVTDVAGYSRLMAKNPDQTLETLTAYRQVFSEYTGQFHGRIVNRPGDSILAEFGSVVDALTCAVEIQRELAERNLSLAENSRMHFRIGLTMGDVLLKEGELYGDGVNIAARLESLADPGGICISRNVYDQVQSRLPLHFEYLGEKIVKNIPEPVRAYKVLSEPGAAAHRVIRAKRTLAGEWRTIALVVAVGAVVVVGTVAGWNYYQQRSTEVVIATFKKQAAFPLPDRPSIAVLAFQNLSGDPEQEYFSDGISEDIITDLARVSGLLVTARNSSFSYKGKAVNIQRVARELGVKYVLEGSVRKAGNRIRITAQLIDAATGAHQWAQRYDRDLQDVFALQDEITEKIVSALKVELTLEENERIHRRTTDNLAAWALYRKGVEVVRDRITLSDLAQVYFKKALALDPEFESALVALGWGHLYSVTYDMNYTVPDPLERAEALARQALALNDALAGPYALLGALQLAKRRHGQALAHARKAVALEPGGAEWYANLAEIQMYAGNTAESLGSIQRALRLDPIPADLTLLRAGKIHFQAQRYEQAAEYLQTFQDRHTSLWKWSGSRYFVSTDVALWLLGAYGAAGRTEKVEDLVRIFRDNYPTLDPAGLLANTDGRYFKDAARLQPLLAEVAKAGLE